MKIKSRSLSFVIITIIYVLATIAGIITYMALPFPFWLNLLISDIVATIITFIFSLIFKNASVYDPYWSVQPPVILTAFAISEGLNFPRFLLLTVVWFWGIRLTSNWAYTFHGLLHQDWRYTMLKETTGKFYPLINFTGIHMVPTLIVYGCVLPGVFLFQQETSWNYGTVIFTLLSLLAATTQGVADIQMHKFRKSGVGGFIRIGLWKKSRHPNYLGEIVMWWGVALAVVSVMPDKWFLCTGALLNTLLFLFVSIPMADKRQSRKPGYESYKKETRPL